MDTPDRANILLVDDEPTNLVALNALLDGPDRRLLAARGADEALRVARDHDLALILLDVRMPGTDGFGAAQRLRELDRSRRTPIIFLTATAEEREAVRKGYAVGAVDFLVKPVVPEVLCSKVAVFVDLFRKSAELRHEIAERQAAEQHVRESEARLRALAGRCIRLREDERTHMAREIHDQLGQVLTALKMDLVWIGRRVDAAELRAKTDAMCRLVDDTVRTVRRICAGLRPEVLDDMGLSSAIAWQTTEFQKRTGVRCHAALPPDAALEDRDAATTLFRIFQEILTNVARHAGATRVDIALRSQAGELVLEVADNGVGITAQQANGKAALGLLGMRERALSLGGTVRISGQRGAGTRVTVSIPRPHGSAAEPADSTSAGPVLTQGAQA